MEEYLNKRSYLNHLKQISAIKNGQFKSVITQSKSKISQLNANTFRQNFSNLNNTVSKFNLTKRSFPGFTNRNKSTEEIMRNFTIQKENLRLVQRIGCMNSEINLKKYQNDYIRNKKLSRIHTKIKKPKEYFKFRLFDIRFQDHSVDPEEVFALYEVTKHKKRLITKGTIFQLRKQQIKTTKNQLHLLKIEGKNWGIVELAMSCFLPITKNKEEVGNLVIDIV